MNFRKGMNALLLAATLLVVACGGDDSMASKSAAAYREAEEKGIPVRGGRDHSGHEAPTTASGTAAMDHAAHGTAADAHAGHDMTTAGAAGHGEHDTTSPAGHAAMGHAASDHAQHGPAGRASGGHEGHRAAPGAAGHDQHAGMQHGTAAGADPHAQHRQPAAGAQMDHAQRGAAPTAGADPHAQHTMTKPTAAPPIAATAPRSNAEMRSIQPASTLRPDAFDAPVPISVSEAAKATQDGTGHSGHGAAAAAVYTCPMHPEVTSDKPGTCPKCGMTLVKKN